VAGERKPTTDEPTANAVQTGPDEEQVRDQQADEARAAERRQAQTERAATLKSVPEGAAAPTEKQTRSGDTSFQQEWLVANAWNVLGYEPHVVTGAFHGWAKEYVTPEEATKRIEEWLNTTVTVHPDDQEEVA
jgi:uncharacterized membrane protein YdbT with pleckstrin-like domain